MEKILYSTSELLFSNRSFWLKTDNGAWIEENNILDALAKHKTSSNDYYGGGYGNRKTSHDFLNNHFWKYFSKRIWQKDDFGFTMAAAAANYIKNANRYKVKFNPFKAYEMFIEATLLEKMTKDEVAAYLTKVGEAFEKNKEITSSVVGVNFKIFKMLYDCQKEGKWNENAWREWSMFIIQDGDFLRNLISIFIHEYLHIILSHLSYRIDNKNIVMWNYACDFAINQSCIFTKSMRKVLITDDNKEFMEDFIIAAAVYQYKNKLPPEITKEINSKFTIDQNNIYENIKIKLSAIAEAMYRNPEFILNCYSGKSSEEYYRILQEHDPNDPKFGGGKCKGYNAHVTWAIDEDDEDITPFDGEITEEDAEDAIDAGELELPEELDKLLKDKEQKRDKHFSVGQKHQGFDAINDVNKRGEARNALKETFNKMGIDANDPNELLKGLSSIPGLNDYGDYLRNFFKVKTKNWKQMLQNCVSRAANVTESDYTMSRESRIRPDFYPGKRMENGLDIILGCDTSGSVGGIDWNDFCNQIKRIAKDFNATHLRLIQCHTRIAFDKMVNISKVETMPIKETGGTMMQVIFEKLKAEKNRKPVVLFTDGEIDHFSAKLYNFRIIMFLSRGHSYCKETLESLGHTVICQDEE